jgi:hypothetical protein
MYFQNGGGDMSNKGHRYFIKVLKSACPYGDSRERCESTMYGTADGYAAAVALDRNAVGLQHCNSSYLVDKNEE